MEDGKSEKYLQIQLFIFFYQILTYQSSKPRLHVFLLFQMWFTVCGTETYYKR